MKARSIFVVALITSIVLITSVSTQAQQDIKLKDYKPVAGKLISAPDNWKPWAKTEGTDTFFSRLKDTGFTPSDNQKTMIMELVKVASFAVFGEADESPLYAAVAETNMMTLTGSASTNPDELLKQINVINVNGRKAGYMVQKPDEKETILRLLYPETERVIAIEIDASNANWKQGDLLKRIATSFRNEGEAIDTEAYKQIDLGLGENSATGQLILTPGTVSPEQMPTVVTASNPSNQWNPQFQSFDGVEMALVPAGCFMMGSTAEQIAQYEGSYTAVVKGVKDEGPQTQICFDKPFWIDKYDVTNRQFTQFNGKAGRDSTWPGDNRPRESITWFEARDFCALRGARLPTEAEWEYAGRGSGGLIYPWGNSFDAANAVFSENSGSQTADVGSKPGGASWVGALDMSGNVWQWTNSLYKPYPYDKDDGRESNSDTTGERVLRGGSWGSAAISSDMRVAFRAVAPPSLEGHDPDLGLGVRCARSAD